MVFTLRSRKHKEIAVDKYIESLQNPLVKQVRNLQSKSRERRKTGLFVIEGVREVNLALQSEYNIKTLLYCKEVASELVLSDVLNSLNQKTERVEIGKQVYERLAYRASTEGVIAIVQEKKHDVNTLKSKLSATPLLLVAEAPEKPGNIGALLRTADAANLDGVIIANPKTDLYNPNIIRSSVGCVFSMPIATGSTSEIIQFLKENNIAIYSAILQDSKCYTDMDFKQSTAIVIGTEDVGLSQEWRKASKQNISIPMQGKIDSMNLSVAAGILIFEAKRQRNFK